MASIVDVAKLAGVSPATVSRVLSTRPQPVGDATRARVLEAARALDFVPNALARGLLKSHVPVVGVIVHDITDPYFNEVVRGIEDAASSEGYLVITCSSDRVAEREESYVRLLRSIRAAVVIFAGSGIDDPGLSRAIGRHTEGIRAYGGAVVHLSPHAFGAAEVGVDNSAGMASIVKTLVDAGHRKVAYLSGPTRLFVTRERLAGYRAGLAAAGLPFEPRLVIETAFNSDGGAKGVDKLLSLDTSFTAVACANDLLAIGAMARLDQLGVRVPDGISVTGFDDIRQAGEIVPGLTTVRLPLRDMGSGGFEYAARLLAGSRPRRQLLDLEVIERGSVGPANPVRRTARRPRATVMAGAR
ncbi:MAG TPA: LacI family DNA-binding transcriptional regulator [Candidatus Limnocylindrales bacterium]|nr:LacI family DNA-binding transcriptional regulator [Candidatus Limnocylindrales bacterium]